jgi:integrase
MASRVQREPGTQVRCAGIGRNHVLPVWGRVQLAAVSHADVATWVQVMLVEGQAPSSVRAASGVLSRCSTTPSATAGDPAASVRLPRLRRTQKRHLTDAEVAALRVRRVRLERRELGIAEGMKDVDGVASYSDTKTHRVRVIPFPAALVQDLAAAAAGKQPTDLVFTSPRGAPLRNGNSRRNVFDPAAARAGLAGLTPHELRHTAASPAVSAGANVKAVQRMLGDASTMLGTGVARHAWRDPRPGRATQPAVRSTG